MVDAQVIKQNYSVICGGNYTLTKLHICVVVVCYLCVTSHILSRDVTHFVTRRHTFCHVTSLYTSDTHMLGGGVLPVRSRRSAGAVEESQPHHQPCFQPLRNDARYLVHSRE